MIKQKHQFKSGIEVWMQFFSVKHMSAVMIQHTVEFTFMGHSVSYSYSGIQELSLEQVLEQFESLTLPC